MTLNYGWCKINNSSTFKIAFEDSKFSVMYKNTVSSLPQDTKIGFSFGVTDRMLKLINARFRTQADAESCLSQMQALQETGTPFKIEWQVNSGGAAGDFFAFDGTNRSMYVLCEKLGNISKAPGDETIFFIADMTFKEANKF